MILRSVTNFVLFQAVWFLSLLLEANSLLFSGLIIVLMFCLSKQKKQDSLLLIKALPLALLLEFIAVKLGLLEFKVYPFPLWLVFLWAALLLSLNTSMVFLSKLKLWQAFLVCMAFAPASYWAGARFGVISLGLPLWQFWLVYGALWSTVFTVILFINQKIKLFINR
ncbi:DUF2878 domain-containing protein [Pseudoalteromonas sp. NZS37]|uniref:DUF2878 domain-containing protein n=1 Tax=Pseudoalteromonas sp. NZS37 TaxID=2792071 RepID=UPI0018CD29D8|nr:DUF2878 domain-containing protein [Pseudoalteromonas sp. NZS37]MBG9991081.1 DUF2878 domain-containing protein [Pseudoalteromonas sp. NZS37]